MFYSNFICQVGPGEMKICLKISLSVVAEHRQADCQERRQSLHRGRSGGGGRQSHEGPRRRWGRRNIVRREGGEREAGKIDAISFSNTSRHVESLIIYYV